jgi:hypothetical protein
VHVLGRVARPEHGSPVGLASDIGVIELFRQQDNPWRILFCPTLVPPFWPWACGLRAFGISILILLRTRRVFAVARELRGPVSPY